MVSEKNELEEDRKCTNIEIEYGFSCGKLKDANQDIVVFHITDNLSEDVERGYVGGRGLPLYVTLDPSNMEGTIAKSTLEEGDFGILMGKAKIRDMKTDWELWREAWRDACIRELLSERKMSYDYDTAKSAEKAEKELEKAANPNGEGWEGVPLEDMGNTCRILEEHWFKKYGWFKLKENVKMEVLCYKRKLSENWKLRK